MSKMNDPDSGNPEKFDKDAYAELFADCTTVEEILALQEELNSHERPY